MQYDSTIHYVIKFVSYLQVGDVSSVSSTNKTDRHDIAEILLKVALNTITPQVSDVGPDDTSIYSIKYLYSNWYIGDVNCLHQIDNKTTMLVKSTTAISKNGLQMWMPYRL
jgi:hypothetical protein